ncbi:hypothetical protein B0J12DRAFT_770468 [Macrophomina phaseolina]|uniref:Uncharacterized protein n=1 Tax=Macrophomina phaseolina TaxID=35725 RepID=A0ABQ8GMP1_9PEZI|nr:hypothetical protein B0J12DRAFT_770468 [Macrophomina phaseolina]
MPSPRSRDNDDSPPPARNHPATLPRQYPPSAKRIGEVVRNPGDTASTTTLGPQLSKVLAALQSSLQQMDAQMAGLRDEVRVVGKQNYKLGWAYEDLKGAQAALRAENEGLRRENRGLREGLEELRRENEGMREAQRDMGAGLVVLDEVVEGLGEVLALRGGLGPRLELDYANNSGIGDEDKQVDDTGSARGALFEEREVDRRSLGSCSAFVYSVNLDYSIGANVTTDPRINVLISFLVERFESEHDCKISGNTSAKNAFCNYAIAVEPDLHRGRKGAVTRLERKFWNGLDLRWTLSGLALDNLLRWRGLYWDDH